MRPDGAEATNIDAERVLGALRRLPGIGAAVEHLEVHPGAPSTNALALDDARVALVVVALEQTAGRGRTGSSWASPRGGLYMSYVPPEGLMPRRPTDATPLAGLAAADAVDGALALLGAPGPRARLKWPNDVLVDGRKVAGVLVQARTGGTVGRPSRTAIGIGINANAHVRLSTAPAEGAPAALEPACLRELAGRPVRLEPLLVGTVFGLVAYLAEGLTARAIAQYTARCDTVGRRVALTEGGSRVEALAVAIDPDGALVVEGAGGARRRVTAGEVSHVRDAGQG